MRLNNDGSPDAVAAVDASLAEFRELYRRPGVRYLGLASLMGVFSALAFYLLDALPGKLLLD